MTHRVLSGGKKLLLTVASAVVVTAPTVIGMLNAPSVRAQPAIPASAPRPGFEVASIKANRNCPGPGRPLDITPGRLRMTCQTVFGLIRRAYSMYPDAQYNPQFTSIKVEGGPGWTSSSSDSFDLDAKAEDAAIGEMMQGPMLQTLLEDRFKLRIHRETRDIPVYEFSVAKGGIKMERVEDGSCVVVDSNSDSKPKPAAAVQKPACSQGSMARSGQNNEIQDMDFRAISMGDFLGLLQRYLDRPLIDKTGLAGRFNLHLQFARDLSASDTPAPSIFTAVQEQLGLKLEPAKGPGEFLVIDSIERPSAN